MIEIGQVIANREIYAIFEKKYCLARALNLIGPEPYTVWLIDADGNGVNSGRYYKEQMDAEWDFAARCFGWFEDNMMIVDPEEQKETASDMEAPGREVSESVYYSKETFTNDLKEGFSLLDR